MIVINKYFLFFFFTNLFSCIKLDSSPEKSSFELNFFFNRAMPMHLNITTSELQPRVICPKYDLLNPPSRVRVSVELHELLSTFNILCIYVWRKGKRTHCSARVYAILCYCIFFRLCSTFFCIQLRVSYKLRPNLYYDKVLNLAPDTREI